MKPIILILAIFLTGCYTKKKCAQFCPVPTKQSDTVIIVKTDSVFTTDSITIVKPVKNTIYITNPCDSAGKLKKGTYKTGSGEATTEVNVTDTGINVVSKCPEQINRLRKEYKSTVDSLIRITETTSTEPVSVWREFYYNMRLVSWGLLLYVLLHILFKVLKFFKI